MDFRYCPARACNTFEYLENAIDLTQKGGGRSLLRASRSEVSTERPDPFASTDPAHSKRPSSFFWMSSVICLLIESGTSIGNLRSMATSSSFTA